MSWTRKCPACGVTEGYLHVLHCPELTRRTVPELTAAEPQPTRWHLIDTPDNETNARAQGGRG